MSLSYTNTPVYIGYPNASGVNTGFTGSIDYVPAFSSDITFQASTNPKRNLGVSVVESDQFTFGAALTANISIQSLIQNEISEGFRFLSGVTREAYVPIQIGENLYQKCYPADFTVNVEPFLPAKINANFICLEPPTGDQVSGDSRTVAQTTGFPVNGDLFVYGHTCSTAGMGDVVGAGVQSQVGFTRSYKRSPVYELGSINASSMLLDGIEEEMSISSTGLNEMINLSGQLLADGNVEVVLQDKDGTMNGALVEIMRMPEGARVVNQRYGVQGGETVNTSVTLKNINL